MATPEPAARPPMTGVADICATAEPTPVMAPVINNHNATPMRSDTRRRHHAMATAAAAGTVAAIATATGALPMLASQVPANHNETVVRSDAQHRRHAMATAAAAGTPEIL